MPCSNGRWELDGGQRKRHGGGSLPRLKCPQGHLYSEHGVTMADGSRRCRLCQREHRRNNRRRKKEQGR